MFGLGPFEIAAILLIALLLFGAKRIPEIARGLGRGIREFKSATTEIQRELTIEDRPGAYRSPTQNYHQSSEPAKQSAPTAGTSSKPQDTPA